MIPKEVLKDIKRIQITTSRLVSDVFAGQYQSVFKGRGMEFYEVRQYQPGDDIRSIDWNVTARTGQPFVKKFVEERELTVMLILDMSGSSYFGTVNQMKSQLAARICSLLAFSAIRNNDKVGLMVFTDKVEKYIAPRKGVRHVLRVIREALYFKPQSKGTDINSALEYLNRVVRRKSVVFLISDFFAPDYKKMLSVANKRHDLVGITITDPRELEIPDVGLIKLSDPETGKDFVIDFSDSGARLAYSKNAKSRVEARRRMFAQAKVDTIDARTDIPYSQSLFNFFRARERRQR